MNSSHGRARDVALVPCELAHSAAPVVKPPMDDKTASIGPVMKRGTWNGEDDVVSVSAIVAGGAGAV